MWVSPAQVVRETEKASIKGKAEIVPGTIYKIIKPLLGFKSTMKVWRNITKRN